MDISHFVNIMSRAWAVPILSSLHEGVAGRQAPLLTATGASRSAFAQSIEHLIKMGLLERNPGHGHPLRPEFRLTKAGQAAASLANRIHIASKNEDQNLLRRSWTIPILTSLQRPRYFNEIKRDLSTITDRALSQSLKAMETRHWVRRSVNDAARPPRSLYETINFGSKISQITCTEINIPAK